MSHKRTINKLSPDSPTPCVKCHIMENTSNSPIHNNNTDPGQSEKTSDSILSLEGNVSL